MRSVSTTRFQRLRDRLAGALLEHRWLLVVLLSASAIIFEILEHQNVENPVDIHFVREVLFFGVVYPIAVGLLLNTLIDVQGQRNLILREREIEQRLNQDLVSASSWRQLCDKIVGFPVTVTPAVGASLLLVSDEHDALELQADWWLVKPWRSPAGQTRIPLDHCGVADHALHQHLHLFLSTDHPSAFREYCLPLFKDDRWLGLIVLYLPPSEQLSPDQIYILNDLAPTIALAVAAAQLQKRREAPLSEIHHERERIARQLHDTLGQNLAYLRLKLDQMSLANNSTATISIQQDLERMRDVAHEAHEQIRQTLVSLKQEGGANLTDLLLAQAQAVAEQAGFVVHPQVVGETIPLPSTIQRKIHAIFREALFNVQRHAQATAVHLSITWETTSVTIALQDDGVGFELDQPPAHGHFGLLIMRQRAEEISGRLTIDTAPSRGTRIVFHYRFC